MTETFCADRAAARSFRTAEEGEKYLDRLLACCKDTGASITRLIVLLSLCMVGFELLNRSAVDTVTITFLELKDQTAVATFLPVVVAVLQYQLVRQMLRWRSLERTFAAVLRAVQPGVAENQLGVYLVPGIPLLSTDHPSGACFSRVFALQHRVEAGFAAICGFGLPGFQVYAFTQLFLRADGAPTASLIVALVIASVLTIAYSATVLIPAWNSLHWWLYDTIGRDDSPVRRRLAALRLRFRRA